MGYISELLKIPEIIMADCEDSKICVGILTVSDRCASGESTDTSGQNLSKLIEDGIIPNAKVSKQLLTVKFILGGLYLYNCAFIRICFYSC